MAWIFFLYFAEENAVVCFKVVKELSTFANRKDLSQLLQSVTACSDCVSLLFINSVEFEYT